MLCRHDRPHSGTAPYLPDALWLFRLTLPVSSWPHDFPDDSTMAADAMAAVPKSWREASYGLGATRWETIAHVVLPAAKSGIFTGIILAWPVPWAKPWPLLWLSVR